MTTDEKFNEIYQTRVNENADDMEIARGEAQVENRHNYMILTVIILINIAINYGIYKLIDDISGELTGILIFISLLIYMKIKHRGGKSKIEKYTMDFKTRIVGTMIKSFEEQLEFTPQYRTIFNSFQRGRI